MKQFLGILIFASLVGCSDNGKENYEIAQPEKVEDSVHVEIADNMLQGDSQIVDSLLMNNGIKITWHEHGKGEKVKSGDMIMINYEVTLEDGTVVDGNRVAKYKLDSIPFMVGFKMQTEGWDLALPELKVGDFATIYIASKYARGEKGIEGLIPPNSDNYLKIKILSKEKPTREIDGVKVWTILENKSNKVLFDDTKLIVFHTMINSPSSGMYHNTWRNNEPFEAKLEDNGLVPGLKKALINAKKADRLFVTVPAGQAYGTKGYVNLVKPNEPLFFNLLVLDVVDM